MKKRAERSEYKGPSLARAEGGPETRSARARSLEEEVSWRKSLGSDPVLPLPEH